MPHMHHKIAAMPAEPTKPFTEKLKAVAAALGIRRHQDLPGLDTRSAKAIWSGVLSDKHESNAKKLWAGLNRLAGGEPGCGRTKNDKALGMLGKAKDFLKLAAEQFAAQTACGSEVPKRPTPIGGRDGTTDSIKADLRAKLTRAQEPELEPPKEPAREGWFLAHPYPMPPNFTGRLAERALLSRWLDADAEHPLLSLRALGGFGKSALVWHWITHDVSPDVWSRVVWWSFYEGDASFDHFLAETLAYLSGGEIDAQKISGRNAVKALLGLLSEPDTLLVLDGFERALRAFSGLGAAYQGDEEQFEIQNPNSEMNERDCVSPLAGLFLHHVALQPRLWSKVLLTTRLIPRVLEVRGGGLLHGCREEELKQMQSDDAVEFFLAQGIRGTHTEIKAACRPYGYHPLSLRLLAGLIVGDLLQPGDIAAAKRLDVSGDLIQRKHHVLEAAYNSLTPERQILLGRIACFRSPVKYDDLKSLATSASLNADLRHLVARGLLHHDKKEGRFDLHPIVRRYAYDRLAAPDRAAAHSLLRDYFAAVPDPDKVTRLEDLSLMIELYHHTVRAGQYDQACQLFRDRFWKKLYYQLGAYQLSIDLLRALFPDGEARLPHLTDESAQAWTLNSLANSYSLNGQPRRAVPLFEQDMAICDKQGDNRGLIISFGNVAYMAQVPIGALRTAEANLRRSIALSQEIDEFRREAIGHRELGLLLAYRGAWNESDAEFATALRMFEKPSYIRGRGLVWACRAQGELLLLRAAGSSEVCVPNSILESARRALELANETALTDYEHPRDYVDAHWLLGAAHRVAGQTDEAECHLHKALERSRRINDVEHEADILIDLARLRAATGAREEAKRLADEALHITERGGYVLQGADARLELANLALARSDRLTALDHAQEARRLATCDGSPDYTYKAAYDEAGALLKQLT